MPTRLSFDLRPNFLARLLPLCLFLSLNVVAASAQTTGRGQTTGASQRVPPTTVIYAPGESAPVAREVDTQCAGFIEYDPAQPGIQVVGGEQESEQNSYANGDHVFVNASAAQGISVGQEFSVVRPRGRFHSKFTRKPGVLGVYTQQVGRLRVVKVKDGVSVAVVTNVCDPVLLGDTLRAIPQPMSLAALGRVAMADQGTAPAIDRFADPSGKQQGRIVLARDGREMVSRNQIVYIDLGSEDNVKSGDLLTIFRPAGAGRIVRAGDGEITQNTHAGFESEQFRGGKFSNKAQRSRKPNGTGTFDLQPVTSPEVKSKRPPVPRKILGEMVVLNVEQRTATAIITNVTQEVHTGDFVEVK